MDDNDILALTDAMRRQIFQMHPRIGDWLSAHPSALRLAVRVTRPPFVRVSEDNNQ